MDKTQTKFLSINDTKTYSRALDEIAPRACTRFNTSYQYIDKTSPVIFLKLRSMGCPKTDALKFAAKHVCKHDSTREKDGPSTFRKLKPKNSNFLITSNGWLSTRPYFNMGRKYISSMQEIVIEDVFEEQLLRNFQANEKKIKENYKKKLSDLHDYYHNLNEMCKVKGANLNELKKNVRKARIKIRKESKTQSFHETLQTTASVAEKSPNDETKITESMTHLEDLTDLMTKIASDDTFAKKQRKTWVNNTQDDLKKLKNDNDLIYKKVLQNAKEVSEEFNQINYIYMQKQKITKPIEKASNISLFENEKELIQIIEDFKDTAPSSPLVKSNIKRDHLDLLLFKKEALKQKINENRSSQSRKRATSMARIAQLNRNYSVKSFIHKL